MIDIEFIEMMYRQRQSELGPLLSRWADVARHAEGKIVVPVSELDEDEKSMAVNLLGPGLDQLAMRVASTMPDISVDPLKPGIKDSENKAAVKRRAMLSWWDMNRMDMILRRRARFLLGYAASPVSISFMGMNPLDKRDIPHWRVLNPMCVFPAKTVDINDIEPPDCIHAFLQPLSWLQSLYPSQDGILYKGKANASTMFEILEYNDCDETVLVALGQAREPNQGPSWERTTTVSVGTQSVVELARVVNKAGIPLTVYPGRITIAGLQGMFDQLMPVYHNASKLAALEYIAIKQSIFPKEWLVSHPNSPGQAEVIVEADGLTGVMGEIRNGQIQQTQVQPSIQASQMQDRLERVGRLAGGLPAELGGECLDAQTEILTQSGWKTYDEVSVGEEVLTLNHDTGFSEWKPVEAMNVFQHSGRRMISAEGKTHSSLSTLNHRWPVVSRDGVRKWKTTPELATNDKIPTAAMCADVPRGAKWLDSLVEVVAWFYTEGSYRQSRGQISQSLTANPEKTERIRHALTDLFGPATQEQWKTLSGCGQGGVGHDRVHRWKEQKIASNGVIKFELSAHATEELLTHCPDKVPSREFLLSLTQSQLELFINVSMLADNCGANKFGQKDIRRSEAFAFAVILAGGSLSYATKTKTEDRDGWRPGDYTANLVILKSRRVVKPKENFAKGTATFEEVLYDGVVWCPTTANGSWFARRRGKVYFTGNSATNIRTAKRGEAVLGSAIDMPVQEHQEIFEDSMEAENHRAIAVEKAYFGSKPTSFYIPKNGKITKPDYTPNDVFENDQNVVKYGMTGTDANSFVIAMGQRLQMETISPETFMEMDPVVEDVQEEMGRIWISGARRAMMSSVENQASQGTIDPTFIARFAQALQDGKTQPEDALTTVHQEMQKEQAAQQASQPPAPGGAPQPGQMPGMTGAPGVQGGVPMPPPGQGALSQILGNLRKPAAQSPSETSMSAQAPSPMAQ